MGEEEGRLPVLFAADCVLLPGSQVRLRVTTSRKSVEKKSCLGKVSLRFFSSKSEDREEVPARPGVGAAGGRAGAAAAGVRPGRGGPPGRRGRGRRGRRRRRAEGSNPREECT